MRIHPPQSIGTVAPKLRNAGMTLVELMFASAIMVVVIAALMSANLMGMREDQWVQSKGGASDSTRKILNQLPYDIKRSKMWFLGTMSGTNFSMITNNSQGTAIQLFQTTNGSTNIIYYFDLSNSNNNDGHLVRFPSDYPTPVVIASNLVNWLGKGYSFVCEDYNGNSATNLGISKTYKDVIHTTLQFCQFQYPLTVVGSNGLYDYYKIEFKATPHLPE